MAAALGYLGVSVVYWQHTLDDLRQRYPATMAMNSALPHNMRTLIAQRDAIYWLESRNAQWASRVLAFQHQLFSVEEDAKSQYVNDFGKYILPTLDKAIQQSTTAERMASHPDGLVNAIQVEVRRANLLQARLRGASDEALMAMPPYRPRPCGYCIRAWIRIRSPASMTCSSPSWPGHRMSSSRTPACCACRSGSDSWRRKAPPGLGHSVGKRPAGSDWRDLG
ncbi:hypothetical protein O0544_14505 [Edwardsiella anguillarum]|nr:hypothetical protein [Edwardsiella anguillarum]